MRAAARRISDMPYTCFHRGFDGIAVLLRAAADAQRADEEHAVAVFEGVDERFRFVVIRPTHVSAARGEMLQGFRIARSQNQLGRMQVLEQLRGHPAAEVAGGAGNDRRHQAARGLAFLRLMRARRARSDAVSEAAGARMPAARNRTT
jgi:hypothetical protein